MVIYICNDCKKILTTVYFTTTQTYEKTLHPHSDKMRNNERYTISTISDAQKIFTCPVCSKTNIVEIELTNTNFYAVFKLIKEDKIKDAWEMLFDTLL